MRIGRMASAFIATTSVLLGVVGCGDDDGGGASATATPTSTTAPVPTSTLPLLPTPTPTEAIPPTVPNFGAASFTHPTRIDNAYFPLVPGTTFMYSGETPDGTETVTVVVQQDTRLVAGVESVIVRDQVLLDGVLIEDTYDWYAQDDAGNVWYMGEEVDDYNYDDEGNLIDITHEGAWEAGKDVAGRGTLARPGYQMKAAPAPGDLYHQEYYVGEAEDMAEVVSRTESVTVPAGSFDQCLHTQDSSALAPDVVEHKFYAPGVGLVLETDPSTGERLELLQITTQ